MPLLGLLGLIAVGAELMVQYAEQLPDPKDYAD